MARKVIGPKEQSNDVLLSGHVVNCLLNIYVYFHHRLVLLLALNIKVSYCSDCFKTAESK